MYYSLNNIILPIYVLFYVSSAEAESMNNLLFNRGGITTLE